MQHTLLSQDFPDDLNCFTYRASHWANEPTCLIKHGGSFQAWSCSDLIRKWLNWWKPSSVGTPQDTSTGSARMGGVQEPLSLKVFISSFIPFTKLCQCSCRRSFFPTSVYFSQHLVHFLEHFIYSTFVKKVGHLWPLLCLFSSFKTQLLQKKLYVGFSRIRTGIVWKASTLTTWPPATAN